MIKKVLLIFIVVILFFLVFVGIYFSKQFEHTSTDKAGGEIVKSDVSS